MGLRLNTARLLRLFKRTLPKQFFIAPDHQALFFAADKNSVHS